VEGLVDSSILKELVDSILLFFVSGLIVYSLSKIMKVKYIGFEFSDPEQSALFAIGAVIISFCMISGLMLATKSQNASEVVSSSNHYSINSVINIIFVWLILLLPILIVKKRRKESWSSTGISKHNLKQSIWIGSVLAVIAVVSVLLFGSVSLGDIGQKLTVNSLWALVYFAVVGFSEEFMFRGFLQIRLMEWLGKWKGWILTSLFMAFVHIPQRIAIWGVSPQEAIISAALLIPISLMMGYILIKTENIIAPGIFHTFANWVNVLM
jgi:membrane protease YdiL (CAAX protease family)